MATTNDVVIGYHIDDYDFVEKLADKLQQANLSVWYHKPKEAVNQTSQAILGCKIYVAIMSELAAVDPTMQEQLALAYISNSAIYPLSKIRFRFLSPKLSGGVKLMLAKINWCFVLNMDEFDIKVESLIKCIKKDIKNKRQHDSNSGQNNSHLTLALNHGQDLGGDDSEFEGVPGHNHFKELTTQVLFWNHHFNEKIEVTWEEFKEKFTHDYGEKIEAEFPDVNEKKIDFVMNMVHKEVFNLSPVVTKDIYSNFCIERHPHAFFLRVQEYTVASLSLRQVLSMDSSLRISTIQNLGHFSFPAIVSGLSELLTDRDPNVRTVAAIALAHAGSSHPETVDKLISLVEDEDRLVRESACLSLGFLRATQATDPIMNCWRNDPISTVREAAELALSKLDVIEAQSCIKVTKLLSSEMNTLKLAANT
ncbi:unnamed protein product [Lymnaea stagnalis]|uniref:TIR domain-containing protein n=1 Tax=Lymnaea stagnalis TaxID=6523 RepID=A0AAV2I769_LYMST